MWTFATRMTSSGAIVLQRIDPSKPVGIRLYGSPLLDTCYEAIEDAGTGGNIDIRKITYGTAGSTLATGAHGLTDGDNYQIEVRWVNGVITVYINNVLKATYDTGNALAQFSAIGMSSSTDGARVGGAKLYVLTQTFAALADVAWWVAGGNLYASDSGPNGGRLIGSFFDPAAVVIGTEWRQKAEIVDGTHAVVFDAVQMTAAPKVIAAGKMPGQSALNTPSGATTAKFVVAYYDRGAGLLQDQYAIFPAIGTDDDFDLTVDTDGKAFVWPSQVGEPLLGAFVATNTRLIMWGRRSTWDLSGDPTIGASIGQLSHTVGGSGPNSVCMVQNGILFLHSEQGAQIIPPAGSPIPLSETVLTEVINAGTADTHYVSVVQDTKSFGIWIFITPQDGSAGRHIFYDQRTGQFQEGTGGFWPITFGSAGVQPTCAMRYLGDVIFGTMDGRMMTFDKAIKGVDGSDEFTSKLMLQAVHPQDIGSMSAAIREIAIIMGLGSAATTLKLFGGDTPERAFDLAYQKLLWQGSMSYPRNSFPVSVTAPAIVLQIGITGEAFALEAVQIDYGLEPLMIQRRLPPLAGAPICAPPVTDTTTPEEPGEGPGPGEIDPGTCTACADWMALNTTETVDGEPAYRLAGPNTLTGAQAELSAAIASFLSQNVCDVPSDFNIYVTTDDAAFVIGPVIAVSDLLALIPGDYDAEDKSWSVTFRCADLEEA